MVEHIAIGTDGLGFDFWACKLDTMSPTLRRFFEAVLSRRLAAEMAASSRHALGRNTASVMKIRFWICSFLGKNDYGANLTGH